MIKKLSEIFLYKSLLDNLYLSPEYYKPRYVGSRRMAWWDDTDRGKVENNTTRKKIAVEINSLLANRIGEEQTTGSYMQELICLEIATSRNPFSINAEKNNVPKFLEKIAIKELTTIKDIYNFFQPNEVKTLAHTKTECKNPGVLEEINLALKEPTASKTIKRIEDFYKNHGTGFHCLYSAFKIPYNEPDILYSGLKNYDNIELDELIGYEEQKEIFDHNLSALLNNCGENMILYGDPGTGKSSLVKACFNKYKDKGVKLFSLDKNNIIHIPLLFDTLVHSGLHYIFFFDDLSFNENDYDEYKNFKAIIDGRIEKKPDNIIFVVTSNHRHLVEMVSADVVDTDTRLEKFSLADRFGIHLTFLKPKQELFLDIVTSIAKREGLFNKTVTIKGEKVKLNVATLKKLSLTFEKRHGGRSGRTAKQFVNSLKAFHGKQKYV